MALQLGCSTILYGGYSLNTAVQRIAKVGYKAMELCAISGMAPHFSADRLKAEIVAVKALAAQNGLVIESVGGSGNLGDADRFKRLLDAAVAVGAPAVTTGSTGKAGLEGDFIDAVKHVQRLIPHAKSVGVKISLKPHVGAAVNNTSTALRFMKEMDAEAVGLNWDASHIWRTPDKEDPIVSLRTLAPYVISLRIRDTLNREQSIGSVATQIPGGGALPLAEIAKEMAKVPQANYVVVEIVGTKDFPLEEVQKIAEDTYKALAPMFG